MTQSRSGRRFIRYSLRQCRGFYPAFLALLTTLGASPILFGQAPAAPVPDQQKMSTPADTPDAQIVETPAKPKTPSELKAEAWSMLTTAVKDDKHPQTRIQGLAALGFLGASPRSLKLIHEATLDKDVDVRTA